MLLKTCLILAASLSLVSSFEIPSWVTKIKDAAAYSVNYVKEKYREFTQSYKGSVVRDDSSCYCENYNCGCCEKFVIKTIFLDQTGCVNVKYLPNEYGYEFVFKLNEKVIIDEKISVKTPPPICAAIPYLQELAGLCIRFYNLDYKDKHFSGCLDIEVHLEHVVLKKYDLGCIDTSQVKELSWRK